MKTLFKLGTVAVFSSLVTLSLFLLFQKETTPTKVAQFPTLTPASYTYHASEKTAAPTDFIEAANKSIHAVVHVKNTASTNERISPLEYFYGRRGTENRVGTGSGVIISPDGLIITNNHVIEDATKIEVTTNDNVRYTARLVGTDAYTDIAVLKIDVDQPLPYMSFGNSDHTQIGEWVLAIGNPFNLNSTVTAGIISAKSRDLNTQDQKNQSFIQTDAAVNRGNSGGALVNTRGELIGINTAITSMSGGFEGYSFAVPSNIARKVFEDIVEYGSTQKGLLGVQGNAITPEFKERFNELNILENEGFYVADVVEGMGAASAGIKKGDILVQVDEVKIKTFSDLTGYLESKRPGDEVNVRLNRNGKEKNIRVLLKKSTAVQFMRMNLRNLSDKEKAEYGIEKGVKIEDAGVFEDVIEKGSLLIEINGERIYSVDDLQQIDIREVAWITYINTEGEKIRLRL